jgi:hypothetical protein
MNEASSSKKKHVDIKYKFIKDLYRHAVLSPSYVTATNMKADILTMILPEPTFVHLRTLIGVHAPGNVVECSAGPSNDRCFQSKKDGSYLSG